MKQFSKNKYFYILLLINFLVFWIWWLPGQRVAIDFSYITQDWFKILVDLPLTWNERGAEGLGEYGVFLLWSWPVSLVFGILSSFGMTFEIWGRLLIVFFIAVGSVSVWQFLSLFSLSPRAKLLGSVFYLLNTYPILLIDGGQIFIAIAYALFPQACVRILKAVNSNLTSKIIAGLTVCVVGFFDLRFIYLIFLLFLLRAIFEIVIYKEGSLSKTIKGWLITGLIVSAIVLGINSYWLIVQLRFPLEISVVDSLTKISVSLVNIGHSLFVIAPHWYKNVFGQISLLKPEFILIPVLVFAAPILKRKNNEVLFWLFVALFSVFLAKGGAQPLSEIYPWLHENIPGFSLFRDSTKFYFLIALSYSILISITSEEVIRRVSKMKGLGTYYFLFILIYFLYLLNPVFLNKMTGTLSFPRYEKEFKSLHKVLQADENFGRTLWIPNTAPLAYFDLNHPVIEPLRIFNRQPFILGVEGTYEIFNFLREAPYMGEIFDVASISYIAYPPLDPKRDDLKEDNVKYYSIFLNQLTNLPWIEKRVASSQIPLLKTKSHQSKIFLTSNTWISFGSDEIFKQATSSANLKLSKNAILLAEAQTEFGNIIDKFSDAKIVLNGKTATDLLASFFPDSLLIFPAKQLTVAPNSAGWWKNDGRDLISWRDFLKVKYGLDNKDFDLGGGWAVGEGELELKTKEERLKKNQILFARVMESSRSGQVSFYQDNRLIGSVDTKVEGMPKVKWFEIGPLLTSGEVTIKTSGDINVINTLGSIDFGQVAAYKQKVQDLNKRISPFAIQDSAESTILTFEKINQTKYRINISNLSLPQTVVFSASYHPLWKLQNQSPVPVYGFLNGFRVEKDGEYILEFEPQLYVGIGVLISGGVLLVLLSFILYSYYKSRLQ